MAIGGGPTVGIVVTANTAAAMRSIDAFRGRLDAMRRSVTGLTEDFRGLDRFMTLLAAGSVAAITTSFFKIGGEMERLRLRLNVFSDSAEEAQTQWDGLFELAKKTPYSIREMADALVKLKAAGMDPIVDKQGNGPLKALADGLAAAGADAQMFHRAIIAVQQMLGKGVVSMEELRQQLGEAMPLALRAMAEGMGMSVAELVRQVSRGAVEAEEGIGKMLDVFEKRFKGAGEMLQMTFMGQIDNIKKNWETFSTEVLVNSRALDFFTAALMLVNKAFEDFIWQLQNNPQALDGFIQRVKEIAIWLGNVVEPMRDFIEMLAGIGRAAADAMGALPEEMIGGGILGLIIFGRRGIIPGAVFGAFSDELKGIAVGIATFIGNIGSVFDAAGMDSKTIWKGGMLGFLIAGPRGAAVGVAGGVMSELIDMYGRFVNALMDKMVHITSWMKVHAMNPIEQFTDPAKVAQEVEAAKAKLKAQIEAAGGYKNPLRFYKPGGFWESMFGDTPEDAEGDANRTGQAVADMFDKIDKVMEDFRAKRDTIMGGLDAQIKDQGSFLTQADEQKIARVGQLFENLRSKVEAGGDAIKTAFIKNKKTIEELNDLIAKGEKKLAGLDPSTAHQAAGIQADIDGLRKLRDEALGANDAFLKLGQGKRAAMTDTGIDRLVNRLEVFTQMGLPAMEKFDHKVAEVQTRINGWNQAIDQVEVSMGTLNLSAEDRLKLEHLLEVARERVREVGEALVNIAQKEVNQAVERNRLEQERAMLSAKNEMAMLRMQMAGDEYGQAIARANQQMDNMLGNIQEKMRELREEIEDGVAMPGAQQQLEEWERIYGEMKILADDYVEHVKFTSSQAGQLLMDIGNQMTSTLGDAIADFAMGTADAGAIVQQMWADAIQALSQYIAKLIMAKVIEASLNAVAPGAGTAVTAMMGLGGFAKGGVFPGGITAFAKGGITRGPTLFGLAGEAGTEAIMPLKRGADGTLGVAASGGGGGDTYMINIQALDAPSVHQLFMQHGRSLVASMGQRRLLNRMDRG